MQPCLPPALEPQPLFLAFSDANSTRSCLVATENEMPVHKYRQGHAGAEAGDLRLSETLCIASFAAPASLLLWNVTNPNPRCSCAGDGRGRNASVTRPCLLNASRRVSLLLLLERFPMYLQGSAVS